LQVFLFDYKTSALTRAAIARGVALGLLIPNDGVIKGV
jgi:hypothetical protein